MKFKVTNGPLACESCGDDAIDEQDLYLGDLSLGETQAGTQRAGDMEVYAADDPVLSDPKFFPATALCGVCLMLKVPTIDGPWHSVSVGGQS